MTLIGITGDFDWSNYKYYLNEAYIKGVVAGKGTPVLLPCLATKKEIIDLLKQIKGVVLSGGGDPDPTYFGDEPGVGYGTINPVRDKFEIMLAKECLVRKVPVLGICRGSQILNIAAGGSIFHDINHFCTIKHNQQAPRWHATHSIKLMDNTCLYKIFKTNIIRVNSFHHQAINQVAPSFIVGAVATDQVIEAIEVGNNNDTFAIGVQWHPEELLLTNGKELFLKLVEEAKKCN